MQSSITSQPKQRVKLWIFYIRHLRQLIHTQRWWHHLPFWPSPPWAGPQTPAASHSTGPVTCAPAPPEGPHYSAGRRWYGKALYWGLPTSECVCNTTGTYFFFSSPSLLSSDKCSGCRLWIWDCRYSALTNSRWHTGHCGTSNKTETHLTIKSKGFLCEYSLLCNAI